MAEIRDHFGLHIVTEAIDNESLELVEEYADVIQIGARNMQNFSLLKRAGRARKPVLLKRGMSATLEEFLMAAEYVMSEGNYKVILCERGVRTFADHTRNTLDLSIVPAVQRLSHLPDHGRSQPRHRQTQQSYAALPRRSRRRRRRPDRRSPPRARPSSVRRHAVPLSRPVRRIDGASPADRADRRKDGAGDRGARGGECENTMKIPCNLFVIIALALMQAIIPGHAASGQVLSAEAKSTDAARNIHAFPIHEVNPNYPGKARKKDATGKIVLQVTIAPDGGVKDVTVESGDPSLHTAGHRGSPPMALCARDKRWFGDRIPSDCNVAVRLEEECFTSG